MPLSEILSMGARNYSARIWTARHKFGLQIENRTEVVDGIRHSLFRVVPDNAPRTVAPAVSVCGRPLRCRVATNPVTCPNSLLAGMGGAS